MDSKSSPNEESIWIRNSCASYCEWPFTLQERVWSPSTKTLLVDSSGQRNPLIFSELKKLAWEFPFDLGDFFRESESLEYFIERAWEIWVGLDFLLKLIWVWVLMLCLVTKRVLEKLKKLCKEIFFLIFRVEKKNYFLFFQFKSKLRN